MALTAKHKEDLALFEAKTGEFSAFMAEHAEKMTDEALGAARQKRDELKSIKSRIEGHVAAAGLSADADGFGSFLNEPGNGMKHLGEGQVTGLDVVDAKKGIIHSQGAGIFGAKVWDGIQDPGYAKAFAEYLRKGEKSSAWALKFLEVGLDPQGGYLAPPEQLQRIVERKPTPTRIAGMVTQMPVGRDACILPRVNYQSASDDTLGQIYTTGFRVTNTEENPSSDTQANVNDTNLFGSVRIDNYTHMMEGVLTNNLVEDPGFDVMGWYEGKFNETIDIFRDDMVLNGTGVQQSTGILPYAANASAPVPLTTITTGTSPQIKGDDLINIAMDVSEQYEDGCKFVFNKTQAFKYLRLLKDSQNRYLFGAGYQDSGIANGKPADLVGYPYVFSALMKQYLTAGAWVSGQTPVIFGDLGGYTQTLRLGFSIQVCRELLARRNQILLVGRIRIGGLPLEPWRLRVLKVA
jgi:HK97 family phage major capsid protein